MNAIVTANGRIPFEPGDVVLIECPDRLNMEQALFIKNHTRAVLGDVQVLVITGGAHLGYVGSDLGTPIYDAIMAEATA